MRKALNTSDKDSKAEEKSSSNSHQRSSVIDEAGVSASELSDFLHISMSASIPMISVTLKDQMGQLLSIHLRTVLIMVYLGHLHIGHLSGSSV